MADQETGRDPSIEHRARQFRARYFPLATHRDWTNWRWQLRHRIKDRQTLETMLNLTEDERCALERHRGSLPVGMTPYFASLLDENNSRQALRRTVVAVTDEYRISPHEMVDPLAEDGDRPVPGIVHRYPDRVLFLLTGLCPVYCRYCTRSRMVGSTGGEYRFDTQQWQAGIDYIASNPAVRDVLISGGDPLVLSDERLEWVLSRLRQIRHVEFIRIGSKIPAALPYRITRSLVRMLRRYHPLWMSLHFTHPDELTPDVSVACQRLADAGIPLGSQTVLLSDINDNAETLKVLFQKLLTLRVRPYYLYQCDLVAGTNHFRVPLVKGLEIMRELRGHTTGYAIPTFVIDLPGGGGKYPLLPESELPRRDGELWLTNYQGTTYRYPEP